MAHIFKEVEKLKTYRFNIAWEHIESDTKYGDEKEIYRTDRLDRTVSKDSEIFIEGSLVKILQILDDISTKDRIYLVESQTKKEDKDSLISALEEERSYWIRKYEDLKQNENVKIALSKKDKKKRFLGLF